MAYLRPTWSADVLVIKSDLYAGCFATLLISFAIHRLNERSAIG